MKILPERGIAGTEHDHRWSKPGNTTESCEQIKETLKQHENRMDTIEKLIEEVKNLLDEHIQNDILDKTIEQDEVEITPIVDVES